MVKAHRFADVLKILVLGLAAAACEGPDQVVARASQALNRNDYKSYKQVFGFHGWGNDHFASRQGFEDLKIIFKGLKLKANKAILVQGNPRPNIYKTHNTYRIDIYANTDDGQSINLAQIFVLDQQTASGVNIMDGYPDGTFITEVKVSETGCDRFHSPAICAGITLPAQNIFDRN